MKIPGALKIGLLLSGAALAVFGQAESSPSSGPSPSASAPLPASLPISVPISSAATVATPAAPGVDPASDPDADYILAPEDTVSVHVANMEELGTAPYTVDRRGNITIPTMGRIHAAGLTPEQLELVIADRLKEFLQNPDVTVSVTQYRSEPPVTILGQVGSPGIQQIHGQKTLFEVLSAAGGLRAEAGSPIRVTRRKEMGPIPLPNATTDPTGEFSIAEISPKGVFDAVNPVDNIVIKPTDVISVPKADMVYILGAVKKPGGFILSESSSITVLQAMAMADGLDRLASAKNTRILRVQKGSASRTEVHVDLQKILDSKGNDVPLQPDDILFIPNSITKNATLRSIEAVVSIGTGLALYSTHF